MQTIVANDTFTLLALDFDYTPQCDGETHHLGGFGHNPTQAAAWVLVMPCCGPKILVCDARRIYMIAQGGANCSTHKKYALAEDMRFLPVE